MVSPQVIPANLQPASPMMADKMILNTQEDINIWALPTDCTALVHAFLASFSVIIVSELGDKTFIITAIMAMKNSRLTIFIASASALLVMTILSVGMGVAVTVIPEVYTHYASIVLFLCFGIKMLKEAYDMNSSTGEESEFEEVKRSLEEEEESGKGKQQQQVDKETEDKKGDETITSTSTTESPKSDLRQGIWKGLHFAPLFIKVFTMIFVAEWGDRSQISTVILAAREDVVGVFLGSFIGHAICTGLAVIGGRFVAEVISVRTSKYYSINL